MEEKKLRSLLRFYKNRNSEIELKINLKKGTVIRGKIIKLSRIFRKYFVIQSQNGTQIKVFFEDVVDEGVMPVDFSKEPLEQALVKSKSNRSPIGPKLRMEVLKRDKFVCQYCGACGPDVELEIDHIIPVSRGGKDDMSNLKTSCYDCNRGKGDVV